MDRRWLGYAGAAALLLAGPARGLDFTGYFRDSIGGNSKGGAQACFKTPGMDYKLRLGNECDNYGEWGLVQSVWKGKDGVEFLVGVMIDYDPAVMLNSGTGTPFGVQQNWVKVKMPSLHGAQFWAGKQYYRRENIDMIDFFYLNTSEPGLGVEDWDVGFGKLAASVFAVKGSVPKAPAADTSATRAFWRPDVRVHAIRVNPNGSLEVAANLVITSRNDQVPKAAGEGTVGAWLTVEHTQDKLLGGSNKLALQWANGPAAQMGPGSPSFGDAPLRSGNMQFRIVEQLLLQPNKTYQALVGTVLQWKTLYVGTAKRKVTQVGVFGRPVYYLSDYFKLQGDVGWTMSKPQGASQMSLFKLCFAPTLTPSPGDQGGFFVRPEIRAFVTWATWNKAARDAVSGTGPDAVSQAPGGGLFGTSTNGLTVGASVETWF